MPSKGTSGLSSALATQQENGGQVQRDDSLHGWLTAMQPELERALPAGGLTANRLARIVLTEVRRTPLLARCTRESFAGAIMTCAQLGLEPGSATGEAYLVPFRNKYKDADGQWRVRYECTLIVGYQGMARLYWQSPLAKSLDAQVVYENDDFEYEYGLDPQLVHRPARGGRGKAMAYYAVATLTTGGHAFVVLWPEDVERIRARSKAKDDGPWKTDYDAMARKTAVRQLFKLIPKSPRLQAAIWQDETVRTDPHPDVIDLAPGEWTSDDGEIHGRDDDSAAEPSAEDLAAINAEASAASPE